MAALLLLQQGGHHELLALGHTGSLHGHQHHVGQRFGTQPVGQGMGQLAQGFDAQQIAGQGQRHEVLRIVFALHQTQHARHHTPQLRGLAGFENGIALVAKPRGWAQNGVGLKANRKGRHGHTPTNAEKRRAHAGA